MDKRWPLLHFQKYRNDMKFSQTNADFFVPDTVSPELAMSRVTHLGIGAHQDDLEFMAMHGILECFQSDENWFGGLVCTDGAGSSRTGKYAKFTDEQMKEVRVQEQRAAAQMGQYGVMLQAGHPSSRAKDASQRAGLVSDVQQLIAACSPEVIYTHNPFDKHATHLGVLMATLEALAEIPKAQRPNKLIGCEVWRGLDWLPDEKKLVQDVSLHPNLAAALNGVFDSQITGGKRYDLAVTGRRLSNATFLDSHSVDEIEAASYAVELTPIMNGEETLDVFVERYLSTFTQDVKSALEKVCS